jgi:ketosteroid isomerase-like protein
MAQMSGSETSTSISPSTRISTRRFRDLGARLLAIGQTRARGKASGAELVSPIAYLVDLRDGKAFRVRTYLDPKEALEAAGLRE